MLGFYPVDEKNWIIAAYDSQRHREYAYSKSLQVKQESIDTAQRIGIAFQIRTNDEVIVVFHIDGILEYLHLAEELHELTVETKPEKDMVDDLEVLPQVQEAFEAVHRFENVPQLVPEERRQVVREVVNFVRKDSFVRGIKAVYERCAICGFQYDYVLDAAHIVPVAEEGTDTYDNGLGLCPTCHRMYDRGFILVDETGAIFINTRHAEEYEQIGRAGSLEDLSKTLRKTLWLPEDEHYHPSPENLRRTFLQRR